MARKFGNALPITKLQPPLNEVGRLERPQLLATLCGVLNHKLALVVAPTGSGKTTLLADACRSLGDDGVQTAWLTLDKCESNPRYFLDHLAIAMRQAIPDAGHEALSMLQGDNIPFETVLGSLINDLTEAEDPLVLFLDDFQEADVPEVSGLVSYLLRYLPANVHLVVASEREFPLPLAWARARGWIIELGWHDLRLGIDEVRAYLQETRALAVSPELVTDLAMHTEGWACAVQLASIALCQRVRTLPQRSGADFADALLEDVFVRQKPEMQRFLLDTSILKRLSPSLCNAVTGRSDGGERLSELERAHFFVDRLDREGVWLRYHELFATFLKQRLRSREPERALRLMRRAGDWFAAHDQVNEALNYWLAAGAVDEAANLLVTHGRNLLRNAEMRELDAWLGRLPSSTVAASPVLCTLKAWCALHQGRPLAIEAAINDARAASEAHPKNAPQSLCHEWLLLRAMAGVIRYDWPDTSNLKSGLPFAFGEDEAVQRAFGHIVVGYSRRRVGDLTGARSSFLHAVELADSDGLLSPSYIAHAGLAAIELLRAQPDRAIESLHSWFGNPARRAYWRNSSASFLRTVQAQAFIDLDRLGDAANSINEAIALLENAGSHLSFHGVALTVRARMHALDGRIDDAFGDLARAREYCLPDHICRNAFRADLVEAHIRIERQELGIAERLLTHARLVLEESGQTIGENVEAWQRLHCQWLLAARRFDAALDLAAAAENAARAAGRLRNVIDFLLCRAIALQTQPGGFALGATCLQEARTLASPGGVRLPFRILASALEPLTTPSEARTPSTFVDPLPTQGLHQREAQILKLLELGLRNKEIGDRLFLSEETVKWYLKRLYDTFEVANRVQLLAKTRRLGLLGETG